MSNGPSVVGRMYNRKPMAPVAPRPLETAAEREKRASKVLGGMKVHGSHIKQVEVDGQVFDVPTAAYVKLLEEQVKEVRNQNRELQNGLSKTNRHIDRLVNEIRKIKDELNNKVDLR